MDNETFVINLVKNVNEKKSIYKMQAEIIQWSEQVIRFNITAGGKSMILEKLLLKHKGQWKLKETNFKLEGNPKEIAMTIMEIQDELEFYLARNPKPFNKFKGDQ